MTIAINLLAANLLPALAMGLMLLWLLRLPLTAVGAGFAMSAGYLLGVAFVALAGWMLSMAGQGDNPVFPALALAVLAGVAGLALLRRRGLPLVVINGQSRAGWLWYLLASALLVNGVLMAHEALLRPVYPWDAWSAWLVKSRVWLAQGSEVDFVSFPAWLASRNADFYTSEAWQYPELIPRFQLWLVQWNGAWHDPVALSPWLFAGLSLSVMAYCGLRLLAMAPLPAMALTFFVSAIPILNVQIALPGLLDLWIAAQVTLFVFLVLLWTRIRRRAPLLLAIITLCVISATKLEGLVWAMLLITILFFAIESRNTRRTGVLVMAAAVASWWVTGGFSLALSPTLSLTLTPQLVELPYLGRFELAFSNHLDAFARSFLALPNWHVTWYALIPALVLAAAGNWRSAEGRGLIALAGVSLGFMILLFFFTHAGMWAQSMTASNRLALHFTPALVLWCGFLLWGSESPRAAH